MKNNFFLFIGLISFLSGFSKSDPKYPVSAIPAELKENVNVVIREDHMIYTIVAKDHAVLHVREAITILNENGKRYASEVIGYDKLSQVTEFRGASYDANGVLLKKLKANEIYDQSAFDGFSLYSDNRIKAAQLSHGTYPYTVEFEYEIDYKYLFMIPGFVIIPGEKASVQNSSYQLIFPFDLVPKYQLVNFEAVPEQIFIRQGVNSLKWKFSNLMPLTPEPFGPSLNEIIPRISVAPAQFEFEGYVGSTKTWDDFGKWILSLNYGRDQLSDEAKSKVVELTSNLSSTEEKVKAIYEYMQGRTRYVSVQLGIGGFQPFEASVVDKNGYGDCKALSNYMVSMLKVAGIKAHYTLIRAGRDAARLNESFPSSQFNHAVVFVPSGSDTIWLECTSQTNPFGYMGTFTGDRRALAITDEGARVVTTPTYTVADNLQQRTADVIVTADGNATAIVKTVYSGLQYENDGLHFILDDQFDDQKRWVEKTTGIPNFEINSFKFENHKARIPSAKVTLELNLRRFGNISGDRFMITPNLMNRSTFIPQKVENRKTEVVTKMGYMHLDTIRYKIPDGIYPEFLPEPVQIKSKFGEYESCFKVDQGSIVYMRKVKIFKGRFPADSYKEYVDFHKAVNRADNSKLVFLNRT